MTAFENFMIGLDCGETLSEQRERLARKVLTPEQYEKRCSVSKPITKVTQKQLSLFEF